MAEPCPHCKQPLPETKPCAHCGETFSRRMENGRWLPPSRWRESRFCSHRCAGLAQAKAKGMPWRPSDIPADRRCEDCGVRLVRNQTMDGLEPLREFAQRRFCSKLCASRGNIAKGRKVVTYR